MSPQLGGFLFEMSLRGQPLIKIQKYVTTIRTNNSSL